MENVREGCGHSCALESSGCPVDHKQAAAEAGRPSEEVTAASRLQMCGSGEKRTDPRAL